MSLDELRKHKQSLTTASVVLSVFLLVLMAALFIHLYRTKEATLGSSGSLGGFGALGIGVALRLKKIKAEIIQRTGVL